MNEMLLLKYGEMALKGQNKKTFEDILVKNTKRRLKGLGKFEYSRAQSTLYIKPLEEVDIELATERLSKVFGVAKICKAVICEKSYDKIVSTALPYLEDALLTAKTFKVEARRSDKSFPMKSPELQRELGADILSAYPYLSVDVHNPEVTVTVEIREEYAFVHAYKINGAGGIPVGTSGKAMLLLSGGIDSPVAGYMMAKRGVIIDAVHFEAPPYTAERAKIKVEKLAKLMSEYTGAINFHCVEFTKIQEIIKEKCPEELFTIIMRRIMMEIAERLAKKEEANCLVTGESIGQVASQTMYAMVCTDAACSIPVFRPLIGMDKTEIVEISRKIGTFETSIEPYEDCCTVFTPKHPKTRPQLKDVEAAQVAYDFEPLIQEAVNSTKAYIIKSY
ncbi:MAG: tRNA 4-thiouridine(8) synthase ThiI [Ruminococcus sp.]|nr:tRNA 4-thiouridine(8) synthase ThiI [Ruminococcus sp.]